MSNDTFSKDRVRKSSKELSRREGRIIEERLGTQGNGVMSRSEVCEMFAISEERLMLVEKKAKELLSK